MNMDAARVERRGERPVSAGPLNEGVELCGMESIDFLPVVKAYPVLSRTYGEVSCIAGIQMNQPTPRWIRLYPVPFRTLEDDQRFKKYQPMSVEASGHSGDRRPETRRPNRDSFRLAGDSLSTDHGWRARRRFVEPLMVDSMCGVLRQERLDRTSLAVFRPRRVLDIVIEAADIDQGKRDIARAWAAQTSLLDGLGTEERTRQVRELELVPWNI